MSKSQIRKILKMHYGSADPLAVHDILCLMGENGNGVSDSLGTNGALPHVGKSECESEPLQVPSEIMKRKIGLRELHSMASQMKYHDFESWVAKELFDQPETVDTSELTNKLFLHNGDKVNKELNIKTVSS